MAKLLQKTEMLRWNVREGRSWESSVSFICPSSSMGGSSFCSSEGSSTGSDHSSPNVWFQLHPSPPAASRGWPCPMERSGRKGPSRVPAGRRRQPRHPARPKGRKPVSEHFIQWMNDQIKFTRQVERTKLTENFILDLLGRSARWRSESVARLFTLTRSLAFILDYQG